MTYTPHCECPECEGLREALEIATAMLTGFADYLNPNPPNRVAWPANIYMVKARYTLERINEIVGGEESESYGEVDI